MEGCDCAGAEGQARGAYAAGEMGTFDAVATFSSVEHSGLGRYGDAFNPWGDLQAVARAWCVTKAGGYLLLGVPTQDSDEDVLVWNAHRIYGSFWYSHLAANWHQVPNPPRARPQPRSSTDAPVPSPPPTVTGSRQSARAALPAAGAGAM